VGQIRGAVLTKLQTILKNLGRQILSWRAAGTSDGVWQGTQLKTEADRRAHRFLLRRLKALSPDTPVVSEEDDAIEVTRRPERYWLIDPIDGTASFASGFPGFVTQVALMERAVPVLAVIYAPALDLLYTARRDSGATLNGRKLRLTVDTKRRVLIDNTPIPVGSAASVYDALGCSGYVESGSISLKICRIADGNADLFFKDVVVRDWDVAAPHLVISEAGGHLAGIDGQSYTYDGSYEKPGVTAAVSQELLEQLVAHLATAAPDRDRRAEERSTS